MEEGGRFTVVFCPLTHNPGYSCCSKHACAGLSAERLPLWSIIADRVWIMLSVPCDAIAWKAMLEVRVLERPQICGIPASGRVHKGGPLRSGVHSDVHNEIWLGVPIWVQAQLRRLAPSHSSSSRSTATGQPLLVPATLPSYPHRVDTVAYESPCPPSLRLRPGIGWTVASFLT